VAPPGDLSDDARPRLEDIVAFRIPGDRVIKLHVATWHAGPHFVHDAAYRRRFRENHPVSATAALSRPNRNRKASA